MSLTLARLLNLLNPIKVFGQPDTEFTDLVISTKEVGKGSLFVALRGSKLDGHEFVDEAYQRGALMCVVDKEDALKGKPGLLVEDTRKALAILAPAFFSFPSNDLKVIGITGTNGKTTTNWLIYNLLLSLGAACIRVGTLGIEAKKPTGERLLNLAGDLTTPDIVSLQRELALARTKGVTSAVMETSSHAIDQGRIEGIDFDVAVYTNLSRDHLDYHKDMEAYFMAKLGLFEKLVHSSKKNKAGIVNIDDEYGERIVTYLKRNSVACYTFGKNNSSDLQINTFSQDISGSAFEINFRKRNLPVRSSLIGYHNVENQAAAMLALHALGFNFEDIAKGLESVPQVPGRLEACGNSQLGVYVDYAHTPDALENVLKALRPLVKGNLWCVFGCGGDRDRGKRPQMGEVSNRLADRVVVTSDNPRTEDPQAIIQDILDSGIRPNVVEVDRRQAIVTALNSANAGDIVLIAGKGHETYQIIGQKKIDFSDVQVVRETLELGTI